MAWITVVRCPGLVNLLWFFKDEIENWDIVSSVCTHKVPARPSGFAVLLLPPASQWQLLLLFHKHSHFGLSMPRRLKGADRLELGAVRASHCRWHRQLLRLLHPGPGCGVSAAMWPSCSATRFSLHRAGHSPSAALAAFLQHSPAVAPWLSPSMQVARKNTLHFSILIAKGAWWRISFFPKQREDAFTCLENSGVLSDKMQPLEKTAVLRGGGWMPHRKGRCAKGSSAVTTSN